jgi:hypothetical protein
MPIPRHPSHPASTVQEGSPRVYASFAPSVPCIQHFIDDDAFPFLFPLDFLRQTAADKKHKKIVNVVERLWMRIIVVRRHRLVLQYYPWAPKTRRTLRLSHPSRWLRGGQHKVHIFGAISSLPETSSSASSTVNFLRFGMTASSSLAIRKEKGVRVNLLSIKS